MSWNFLIWGLFPYLAGSFPTAYVAAKVMRGVDIRSVGSGNVGATNLGRVMGKKWAVLGTIVDMLKGGLPVLLVRYLGYQEYQIAFAAIASVLGHDYPVWLKFKGGKGVATTYGALFFACPWQSMASTIAAGLIWFFVLYLWGYVSSSSIISMYSLVLIFPIVGARGPWAYAAFFLATLSAWRHRSNIKRLLEGRENRVKMWSR